MNYIHHVKMMLLTIKMMDDLTYLAMIVLRKPIMNTITSFIVTCSLLLDF
jgi:hypothetical protein